MTKHYSWEIDPATGDYVMANGSPVRDESLQFPAYARLKIQKEKWMYAPDRDYGSSLSELGKKLRTTATLARKLMEKALEPILNDGRASDITVNITEIDHFAVATQIQIIDQDNQEQTIELRQVNV